MTLAPGVEEGRARHGCVRSKLPPEHLWLRACGILNPSMFGASELDYTRRNLCVLFYGALIA